MAYREKEIRIRTTQQVEGCLISGEIARKPNFSDFKIRFCLNLSKNKDTKR